MFGFPSFFVSLISSTFVVDSYREYRLVRYLNFQSTYLRSSYLPIDTGHPAFLRGENMASLSPPNLVDTHVFTSNATETPRISKFTNTTSILSLLDREALVRDIIAVGIPSLAACVVEPLLTVIDSIFVGRFSVTPETAIVDLAAMSINGALFNVLAAATAPLCAGTTALVSAAQGKGFAQSKLQPFIGSNVTKFASEVYSESFQVFDTGVAVSAFLGLAFNLLTYFSRNFIIQKLFSPSIIVLQSASRYFWIRMLSFPFTLANYVVVGYSLGTQNVFAPVASILTSFLINVLGDYIFISRLKLGLAGAAAATSLSSILGTSLALWLIRRNKKHSKDSDGSLTSLKFVDQPNSNPNLISKIKNRLHNFSNVLNLSIARQLFSTSTFLLAGTMLNTLTYSAGARISSYAYSQSLLENASQLATIRTLHIASHQIAMQVWWFLSFFSSPLSLVAQALLPKSIASRNKQHTKSLVHMLTQLGFLVAVAMALINGAVQAYMLKFFTTCTSIVQLVRSVTSQIVLSQFIICLATVLDGFFVGANLLPSYVTASYLSTSIAWLYYSYSIKNRMGLQGTWNGLLIFSCVRLLYFIVNWRVFRKAAGFNTPEVDGEINIV